ncbi:methylenetetrahydrofolate reductase C-terminal domain-containing protein [Desulfurobacterium thermolithotrophum]|uniref:methylenetetrahydrofolate reductase C-terminal domain-containing protein n=1 Tax=Desulfurobacterium thermolithotrophum TaxID=64160 RepID=UPI0013CF5128|nr:methylenetetrahydrofolate reductase C-terminal domain-containing protein [Desulfurobacterium thermolithotrophum]
MVVVRLKPLEEILETLKGFKRVFIFGCELGSSRCKNGGLKEAKILGKELEKLGFKVTGIKSPGGTCVLERIASPERNLLKEAEGSSDVIVSLACGAGTQLIAENVDIPVLTGVSTIFIGAEREGKYFDEYCIACGDCIISRTGGICPVARCPKSLTAGPCGGAIDGKCEIDPSMPCIWYTIAQRLEKLNQLDVLLKLKTPMRDYRKSIYPRRFVVED